jgi:endonuclease YncB( thermonuclease family)
VAALLAALLGPATAADLSVTIREVIDGDTVRLNDGRLVRYVGVNAPEPGQPFAREATMLNRQLVLGRPVRLEFDDVAEDRHGRLLAYVYRNGTMINERLLDEGVAHLFLLPPNVRHATRLLRAQEQAKAARRGMWTATRGPLKITRVEPRGNDAEVGDPLLEFVRIANVAGHTIDVGGYSIADRRGHDYRFPSARLRAGHVLTLVTGPGRDRVDEAGPLVLYWNRRRAVWNNRGDTATLKDSTGRVVDRFEYTAAHRRPGRPHGTR